MLFSHFENVLNKHIFPDFPLSQNQQIILAFSGGVDSRVMLDLLATYRDIHPQYQYLVVHVNHGLSPNAACWQKQCQAWVSDANFAFVAACVEVKKEGKSIEQAAREARYSAISSQMGPNALVLTAQHADDQTETFLLALKRGSGLSGLAAMPEIRPFECGFLLRPLLDISRDEIERYADDQGLTWIEDESNKDNRFDRNFIRNEWLPLAQSRWQGLSKAINRSASLCAQDVALIEELLTPYEEKVITSDGALSLLELGNYSLALQTALVRRWLKRKTLTSCSKVQVDQIFQSIIHSVEDANPCLKLGDWQLRRFQQHLYLVPDYQDISQQTFTMQPKEKLLLPLDLGELVLSAEDVTGLKLISPESGQPISIKFDPEGLSAHPVGRQGKRKLKKLFQEYGVPSWQRRRTPLIYFGDTLVAVADLFVCDGFEGNDYTLVWYKLQ